ncbi:MAG: hypothetical protein AVO38_15845 [delta proteobacterium ML8_D]|nr:MAG: hypothetical protein AVO38_15845 [delta proteobacterium ML8_D]
MDSDQVYCNNILAAIGRVQLIVLQERVNKKWKIFEYVKLSCDQEGSRRQKSYCQKRIFMGSSRRVAAIFPYYIIIEIIEVKKWEA